MISVVVLEQSDPRLSPFYVEVRDATGARLLGKGCQTYDEAHMLKTWSEGVVRAIFASVGAPR